MVYSCIFKSPTTGETIVSRHLFDSEKELMEAISKAGITEFKIRAINKKFIY